MHKAYDRIEWIFLEKVMLRMGFDARWVKMIMACVSSVEYKVRFNSQETDRFLPSRGLRQGDPLSPYLFLLCAEGLTSLIAHAEETGELQGVKVCREAPPISNLLFADDSLMLIRANEANASCMKRILDQYCAASGQLVSDSKSCIFFSPNTNVHVRVQVCQILNILTESLNDTYLGLPTHVGLDKSECFQYLVDRVCQRIEGWKEKILSLGGKEVLLKAVAQAIPSYAMSVFKIPKSICKGITDAMSHYWWGDEENQKRMHWFAWWKMCVPKDKGGMGFRDIHCFNLAMLAKQAWRLIFEPDSLCATILRAKYFPDGNLLDAKLKKGSSYTWQSIMAGVQCLRKGCIWRIGDGNKVNIWEDPWVPSSNTRGVVTRKGQTLLKYVNELIDPVTGQWDEDLVRTNFWSIDVERIMRIPLSDTMEDFIAWHYTKIGFFSVRSTYHVEWDHQHGRKLQRTTGIGSTDINPVWRKLWGIKVPTKVKKKLHGKHYMELYRVGQF
jgi:hypothetical protein